MSKRIVPKSWAPSDPGEKRVEGSLAFRPLFERLEMSRRRKLDVSQYIRTQKEDVDKEEGKGEDRVRLVDGNDRVSRKRGLPFGPKHQPPLFASSFSSLLVPCNHGPHSSAEPVAFQYCPHPIESKVETEAGPSGNQQRVQKQVGLKRIAAIVLEKVQKKGTSMYEEVANELVNDLSPGGDPDDNIRESKNIRRRVYDALNVLEAAGVLEKSKKSIRYVGTEAIFKSMAKDKERKKEAEESKRASMQTESEARLKRIEEKQRVLQILIEEKGAFELVVERNKLLPEPVPSSVLTVPFLLLSTAKDTNINCSLSCEKSVYCFEFDRSSSVDVFKDFHVLRKLAAELGLGLNLQPGLSGQGQRPVTVEPNHVQDEDGPAPEPEPLSDEVSDPTLVSGILASLEPDADPLSPPSSVIANPGTDGRSEDSLFLEMSMDCFSSSPFPLMDTESSESLTFSPDFLLASPSESF